MSITKASASISIKNNTGGNAWILLYHENKKYGTQRHHWKAAPGHTVGPMTVYFEFPNAELDFWSVLVHVKDGPAPGFYVSHVSSVYPYWKECQLGLLDNGREMTFKVSPAEFHVALHSGGCTAGMKRLFGTVSPVTHVFVVMLENHSFDNMLAMSDIAGINAATTKDSNSGYHVQRGARLSLPKDPGHEFLDVIEQLGGERATYTPGHYPPINNSGFVADYARKHTGEDRDIGDIMKCFATATQLPVLYQAAADFTVCDHWYSSLPGPTWPNRYFLHGASSSGLDDSQRLVVQFVEETIDGFPYRNGSIYEALHKAGIPYRFYNDSTEDLLSIYSNDPRAGDILGAVPQVTSLKDVDIEDFHSLRHFASNLAGPYPYPYTFIEPHWGNLAHSTYRGGSSQHPMDDVYGGEHLLAAVYNAIRASPYWESSLLIITYDEHGGFYDHIAPPKAPAPHDSPHYNFNVHGFDFTQYGVRVPAVIVSPLIPVSKRKVDHTLYDHSSVPKTLEELFGLAHLTERDRLAHSLRPLLSLTAARTDCPKRLNNPIPPFKAAKAPLTVEEMALIDAEPLPESGNLVGALLTLRKTEIKLSGRTPPEIAAIDARFRALKTRGDARVYAASVLEKVAIAKQQRELS